ncbi:regulator protein FrmR [Escherichia coli]|uniref:Regulator protein FrmR n=1 Tax=Escherichia coli TaxID=562 RepID=A0A377E2E3_ECOLX|nr:regulator protein FrmR [Escherichia coli]
MPSTPEEKKKVLTRVRRIRGQIDALERSLEGDANAVPYSTDRCRSGRG